MEINWYTKSFIELSPQELYAILKLRSEIFVVEQKSIYLDLDDFDQDGMHLMGWANDDLVAYGRIAPAGLIYKEMSIGRIIIPTKYRGNGYGHELMERLLVEAQRLHSDVPIRIMAQCYLKSFYKEYNFKIQGEEFIEDGILHVYMVRG